MKYAKTKSISLIEVKDFEAVAGKGVTGTVTNIKVALGNKKIMEQVKQKKANLNEMISARQSDVLSPRTLSPEVAELLMERLGDEYTAHYFYRNAANWCLDKGYMNAGAFFTAEAASELTHA